MLILVCSLVILECMCVMAELMVDLHGIRVIFNQEEHELKKFIDTMRAENENCTVRPQLKTFSDILDLVTNTNLQTANRTALCNRRAVVVDNKIPEKRNRQHRSILDILERRPSKPQQSRRHMTSSERLRNKRDKSNRNNEPNTVNSPNIFIFAVHTEKDNYFLISSFEELTFASSSEWPKTTNMNYYKSEYEKIQTISHTIKYVGFSILSLMVIETLVKIVCLGMDFFRKKIEVFDAFIVLVSFALDVVFIDSKWYETGKDVTTVLVLLLPWRIVRIINSFVMTINHKHHIQMMTLRRSKKKVVLKLKKLRHLMLEMRRDIDQLITLSKSKGATDPEVFNCIYGKGRGTKSLAAITSFASLMFISTLGKDLSGGEEKEEEDDMYGELIRDILEEEGEDDDEDTEIDKTLSVTSEEKDIYIEIPRGDTEETIVMENAQSNNKSQLRRNSSHSKITRRVTLPRRLRSCSDDDKPVFFINDAYDVEDDVTQRSGQKSLSKRKRTVQSLPHICSSVRGKNFVTFEVTTQVTYL